jgi:protoporphyrinogen oxidase
MSDQIQQSREKVAVIGAGPAGLAAAFELSKAGFQVHIYEAGASVGGLAKSITLWNQRVDLGPHRFFTRDKRVEAFWREVIQDSYVNVPRLTRILYNGKYFHYPLQFSNIIKNLPFQDLLASVFSYVLRKRTNPNRLQNANIEDWFIFNFGDKLYRIFFKDYTEKLWGISCQNIDADFAKQRIKKLNLFEAVLSSVISGQKNKHRTLVDTFQYPKMGAGQLYELAEKKILGRKAKFFFNSPVKSVTFDTSKKEYTVNAAGGNERGFAYVLSTMPITELVNSLGNTDLEIRAHLDKLKFRSTILVYLHVDSKNLFPDNWIYINSPELKTGRITNYRNWSPHTHGEDDGSVLSLEYWCQKEDSIWNLPDSDLIKLAKDDLTATGLCSADKIFDGKVLRIEKSYPVYEKNYKQSLLPVQKYIDSFPGLFAIGRYGSFKYNNQDHSILMGLLAAENIIHGKKHNLWDSNSDVETYQESGSGQNAD